MRTEFIRLRLRNGRLKDLGGFVCLEDGIVGRNFDVERHLGLWLDGKKFWLHQLISKQRDLPMAIGNTPL